MVVFATAAGVPELLVARVIQGIATGAALGAIGAGLLDLDRARGTVANAVAPGAGTASGALLSGLVVQFLPAPTHLVYVAAIAVFALQAIGVVADGRDRHPSSWCPPLTGPPARASPTARRAIFGAAPVLFAVWALAGFYGALGPAIVHEVSGSSSLVMGGLSLFVLAGVAAVSVYVLREADPHGVMALGILALVTGVATTLAAIDLGSTVLFFIGTAVAGVGFGSGFQGGIRTVMPLLHAHERAGVLSVLYIVSYLGMGLPAVPRRSARRPRRRTADHVLPVRRRRDGPRAARPHRRRTPAGPDPPARGRPEQRVTAPRRAAAVHRRRPIVST